MSDFTGIGSVANLAKDVIDRFFPDKTEQEKAVLAQAMAEAQNQFELTKEQIKTGQVEAASQDRFTSRARASCIWVGAASMAYVGIVDPVMRFLAQVCFHYQGNFPQIDTTVSFQVLFALLGISGMRSFDKRRK